MDGENNGLSDEERSAAFDDPSTDIPEVNAPPAPAPAAGANEGDGGTPAPKPDAAAPAAGAKEGDGGTPAAKPAAPATDSAVAPVELPEFLDPDAKITPENVFAVLNKAILGEKLPDVDAQGNATTTTLEAFAKDYPTLSAAQALQIRNAVLPIVRLITPLLQAHQARQVETQSEAIASGLQDAGIDDPQAIDANPEFWKYVDEKPWRQQALASGDVEAIAQVIKAWPGYTPGAGGGKPSPEAAARERNRAALEEDRRLHRGSNRTQQRAPARASDRNADVLTEEGRKAAFESPDGDIPD